VIIVGINAEDRIFKRRSILRNAVVVGWRNFPYEFESASRLLEDFWAEVEEIVLPKR